MGAFVVCLQGIFGEDVKIVTLSLRYPYSGTMWVGLEQQKLPCKN